MSHPRTTPDAADSIPFGSLRVTLPRARDRDLLDVERLHLERERAGALDGTAVAVEGEVVGAPDCNRVVGAVAGGEHEEEREDQEASHGRTARAGW